MSGALQLRKYEYLSVKEILIVTWPSVLLHHRATNVKFYSLASVGACNLILHIHVVVNWQLRGIVHTKRDYSLLSTLIRFQKYAFSFSSKMHRSIRLHTTVLVRFRIARCDVCWTLYARCKHTLLWYFRSSFSFWSVFERFRPSTLIGYPMYAFHSDEPLRTYSNRWVAMKTLSVLVWAKREWSILFSLVWTKGLNAASKCMPFTMNKIFRCTCDFLIILLRWRFRVFLNKPR